MGKQYSRPVVLSAFWLHLFLLVIIPVLSFAHAKCVLFNFGDSNSDPGAFTAALGLYLGPPAGQQFFHKTTGRFCNGRLYIDFICKYPFSCKSNIQKHNDRWFFFCCSFWQPQIFLVLYKRRTLWIICTVNLLHWLCRSKLEDWSFKPVSRIIRSRFYSWSELCSCWCLYWRFSVYPLLIIYSGRAIWSLPKPHKRAQATRCFLHNSLCSKGLFEPSLEISLVLSGFYTLTSKFSTLSCREGIHD